MRVDGDDELKEVDRARRCERLVPRRAWVSSARPRSGRRRSPLRVLLLARSDEYHPEPLT